MNSMTCRRPNIVSKLEFINKFDVVVSYQSYQFGK